MKPRESASERRARSLAERIRERELEEQQRREVVIAEFGGRENPDLVYALVDVILRYRFAVAHLADAIGWMQKGTPFITMGPAMMTLAPRQTHANSAHFGMSPAARTRLGVGRHEKLSKFGDLLR